MAALTVLADIILPNSIIAAAGLQGRNLRSNTRRQSQSGHQNININWARTLRQYDLGFIPMLPAQWALIEGLHEETDGGAYGFLVEDPKDCSATVAAGRAALTSGTSYQLQKLYTSAGSVRTNLRTITRPRASDFAIFTSGTPIVTFTLDDTTGIVTIPSAPAAATLTWSGGFYVPVHFATDDLDWDLLAGGPADSRLIAGRSVTLQEVRE